MKEILTSVPMWVKFESVMLSEVKERHIIYDMTYMWNPKKLNLQKMDWCQRTGVWHDQNR